ncbi:MAG: NTP transferase domain-containing protein [Patescibacteria group bacterium]
MAVTYILCAAGEGTRFKKLIPHLHKPLINLRGKSLLEWSIESLPIFHDDELFIISQKSHQIKRKLQQRVEDSLPFNDVKWIELMGQTRGQLETAVVVEKFMNKSNSVAIYNCDSYFQSPTLINLMSDKAIEGIIPCSRQPGDAWSFCKINRKDEVISIQEKKRISPWATVGFYFFRDSELFFSYAKRALERPVNNEFFVAPLYMDYIHDGYRVVIDRLKLFKPMGTPEQISRYWRTSNKKMKRDNLLNKTLVVDIDNTITIEDNTTTKYNKKRPNTAVINKLRQYKELGYTIVLHTARRMKTHNNDESSVVKDVGAVTLSWLRRHGVPFDGIKFGKPYASAFTIDDRSVRPSEFITLTEEQIEHLLERETIHSSS